MDFNAVEGDYEFSVEELEFAAETERQFLITRIADIGVQRDRLSAEQGRLTVEEVRLRNLLEGLRPIDTTTSTTVSSGLPVAIVRPTVTSQPPPPPPPPPHIIAIPAPLPRYIPEAVDISSDSDDDEQDLVVTTATVSQPSPPPPQETIVIATPTPLPRYIPEAIDISSDSDIDDQETGIAVEAIVETYHDAMMISDSEWEEVPPTIASNAEEEGPSSPPLIPSRIAGALSSSEETVVGKNHLENQTLPAADVVDIAFIDDLEVPSTSGIDRTSSEVGAPPTTSTLPSDATTIEENSSVLGKSKKRKETCSK